MKFKTRLGALRFVQRAIRKNGGPNKKILAMRRRYLDAKRARDHSVREPT